MMFRTAAAVVSTATLFAMSSTSCKAHRNKEIHSETDAISAVSKRIFGNNVRGYMWALTTANPSKVRNPGVTIFGKTLPVPGTSKEDGTEKEDVALRYYQCWYYAETPFYVKLEGDELRKLFLDKKRTSFVNNRFVDVQYLYRDQQRNEILQRFLSIASVAAPFCGTIPAFVGEANLKKGIIAGAVCSVALAAPVAFKNFYGGGDQSLGSEKARAQIEAQLKARVDQLEEVSWEVLAALKKNARRFNKKEKAVETTDDPCPPNDPWVADLMGEEEEPEATPTPEK